MSILSDVPYKLGSSRQSDYKPYKFGDARLNDFSWLYGNQIKDVPLLDMNSLDNIISTRPIGTSSLDTKSKYSFKKDAAALGLGIGKGLTSYVFDALDWMGMQGQQLYDYSYDMTSILSKGKFETKEEEDLFKRFEASRKEIKPWQLGKSFINDMTFAKELASLSSRDSARLIEDTNADLGQSTAMFAMFRDGIRSAKDATDEWFIKRQDLDNVSAVGRFGSELAESLPYTAASAIPYGIGFLLNFGTHQMRTGREKVEELKKQGDPQSFLSGEPVSRKLTDDDYDNIMTYATGAALIEAASEQIFKIGAMTAGKTIAKEVATQLLKKPAANAAIHVSKFLVNNGLEEGLEEVFSYVGQGFLAKMTTNPNQTFLGVAESSGALVTLQGLGKSFLGGFVMGSVISTVSTKKVYNQFTESKKVYEIVKTKTIDELTDDIQRQGLDAFMKDLKNTKNVDAVREETKKDITRASISQPLSELISQQKITLNEFETAMKSTKNDTEVDIISRKVEAIRGNIKYLETEKRLADAVGSEWSEEQLVFKINKYKEDISDLNEAIKETDGEVKNQIQETIDETNTEIAIFVSFLDDIRELRNQVVNGAPIPRPKEKPVRTIQEPEADQEIDQDIDTEIDTEEYAEPEGSPDIEDIDMDLPLEAIAREESASPVIVDTDAAAKDIAESPKGDTINSSYSLGERVDSVVAVVPAKSIIPSMDGDLNEIAAYDKTLQPRDVKRADSATLVDKIARNPVFDDLFRKETIGEGIPVVDQRGMVVAGNHRIAGIFKMMRDYPQNYEAYKQYAIDHATEIGLTPDQLQGDFIITRVLPQGVDAKTIANLTNVPRTRGMSPTEIAVNDSGRLTDEMLSKFVGREDGIIRTKANEEFLKDFASKIIAPSELNEYTNKDGDFNADGIRRIVNAIFHKAYGDTALLDRIAESTDNDIKKITTAMLNVAPMLVEIRAGIKNGRYHDIDIAPIIKSGAEEWIRMKESGDNVQMYASQTALGDTPEIIRMKNILFAMDINKGSAKRMTELYSTLIDAIKAAGAPNQISLFSNVDVTIDNIINAAKRIYDLDALSENIVKGEGEASVTETAEQQEGRGLPRKKSLVKKETARQVESKQEAVNAKPEANDDAEIEYAKTISEASKSQDKRGILNIISEPYIGQIRIANRSSDNNVVKITDYEGVQNEVARDKFDESKRPAEKGKKSTLATIKQVIQQNFFRASVPEVAFSEGQVRNNIQKLRKRYAISSLMAWEGIKGIYNPLAPEYRKAMDYAVFLPDLVEDIELGKYDNKELPFFDTVQEVIDENQRLKDIINDDMDTTIKKALERRKKVFKASQLLVNAAAEKAGVDFSGYFKRTDYVHHAIIEFINKTMEDPKLKNQAIGILKARDGSQKEYITDAALADFLALQKLAEMEIKLNVLSDIREQDIAVKNKFEIGSDGKYIIPDKFKDKYTEVTSFDVANFNFPNQMVKTQAVKTAFAMIDELGLKKSSPEALKLIRDANKAHRNTHYVIPKDVALAYQNMFKLERGQNEMSDLDKAYGKAMTAWKRYQLMSPRRALTYNLRNSVSDFAKTLGFMPNSLKYVVESVKTLTNYMRDIETTDMMMLYIRTGGYESAPTNIALGDYETLNRLKVYEKKTGIKNATEVIGALHKAVGGIENFYQWREQIFRFAGFMYFMKEGLDPKTNLPIDGNYRGSKPAEIQAIKSRMDIAYKMSNDIVGAYDDVTPATRYIAKRLKPFFRFQETNNRTYFRGLMNAFYNDPNLIQSAGEAAAAKTSRGIKISAYTAMRLGKFVLMASLVDLALAMWNNLVVGDEDEQIPSYARDQSHITLGKWGDKVYYLSNVGSLREALEWIGFSDPYSDFRDLATGKKTYKQKVEEIIKAPATLMFDSVAPFLTPIIEAQIGRSLFTGQAIRDKNEHIASFFQLAPAYRAITGKPQIDGSFNWNIFSLQKAFENEQYFWSIYDMRDEYLISLGKTPFSGSPSTDAKSRALYELRTAIRYNDEDAAKKYLFEYMVHGGNLDGIKASARALHPLQSMNKKDRENFVAGLAESEKEIYDKGMAYYEKYADDIIKFYEYNYSEMEKEASKKAGE